MTLDVSRETRTRLDKFEQLLRSEAAQQNLVAASTIETLRERHIADSLQLLRMLPDTARSMVDVGSGAGLPGLVLAIASDLDVTLIEPRSLRADFLQRAVEELGLSQRVEVLASKADRVTGRTFDVITARALAPLDRLLRITAPFTHPSTVWILPKGRTVHAELAEAGKSWHGRFEVRASETDAEAGIIVASGIRRKARR